MLEVLIYMNTRDQSNVEGVKDILADFNALNAMYVEPVKNSVCGFYTTLHTEYYYSSSSC